MIKNIKYILVVGILLFSALFAFSQDKEIVYAKSFEAAQEISVNENKLVLLIFSGTDWCRPCMIFDQTVLSNSIFIEYANQNLSIYKASFPRRKKNALSEETKAYNEKLASIYNKKGAFPNVLLFHKKSNTFIVLDYNQSAEQFTKQIENIISKE